MLKQVEMLGGVNLLDDPKRIRDDELCLAQNLWPREPGIVSKRRAMGLKAKYSGSAAIVRWLDLHIPPFTSSADVMGVYRRVDGDNPVNTTLYFMTDGGTDYSYDMGAITTGRPAVFAYQQKMYVFGGPGTVRPKVFRADNNAVGFAVEDLQWDVGNEGLRPRFAIPYRSRFLYGDFGGDFSKDVGFSDNFKPGVMGPNFLAADGRHLPVGGDFDGAMTGVVDVMLSAVGSPVQSAALVLFEYAAYVITGEPGQSDDATELLDTLEINRVSFNCGCASAATIVRTPYGTLWAGHDDVWLFDAGQVPRRVGTKIRPALAATPADLRYLWHAAYFNGSYRLAVMSEGQGASDDSGCDDQWWLDLRNGPPPNHVEARWWGPQKYRMYTTDAALYEPHGTRIMRVDSRPSAEPALLGIIGNEDGHFLQEFDVPGARDADGAIVTTIAKLDGTEIEPVLVTKDYDFKDSDVNKIVKDVELSVWASHPTQLIVDDIIDGGNLIDRQGLNVAATLYQTNIGTAE